MSRMDDFVKSPEQVEEVLPYDLHLLDDQQIPYTINNLYQYSSLTKAEEINKKRNYHLRGRGGAGRKQTRNRSQTGEVEKGIFHLKHGKMEESG
ncbi:hypothetical protein CEXT_32371 [Caerostris extrusa]|uniref:Ribosomal protein L4 n=1 Tax=Caerostris extrusa TaxID=172846 RepID=A0AAV4RPI7_CAEEX|nr:hypothetical protein CEXT_32371 [Caerostris extrusa]